ncbi:MAG TPA: hypothetical protein VKS00_06735, partial [Candidatus Acidoferrales bacterium]|nr:hypothetical protein [Candidatus Acidoferrales bacterium]
MACNLSRSFGWRVKWAATWLALAVFASAPNLSAQDKYQKPPQKILDVLFAPAPPVAFASPQGDEILVAEPVRYPPISELARPMLRIAGARIDPANSGQHNPQRFLHLALVRVSDGRSKSIEFPAGPGFGRPEWAPDGKHFFVTVTADKRVELWIGSTTTGTIRRLAGIAVNSTIGEPCTWTPEKNTLLCRTVPVNRGRPPAESTIPVGPIIQESFGKAAPAPTFEDLLQSPRDEQLFDYYAASQLAFIDVSTGKATPVGKPGIFETADPAPDGRYILIARLHHPYSYIRPLENFARTVEVWDRTGHVTYKLADLPLQETIPIGGVPTGPRSYQWQATAPATLVWVDALDGGNPHAKVANRDRIMWLKAPFTDQPAELARTEYRFAGLFWGERGDLAMLRETDRSRLWERTWFLNPQDVSAKPRLVWDMSAQERYKNPGQPVMRVLANGHRAMVEPGADIFLAGPGASPEGDRPFLDRFNTQSLQAERIFHCDAKSYEEVVALASLDGSKFITRHETPAESPNYFLRTAGSDEPRTLTHYVDHTPQLRGIRKELVNYKRADGVPLSMTVYLPADYKEGERRPAVIWAYPREFTNAQVAGEVTGSPNRFTEFTGLSP